MDVGMPSGKYSGRMMADLEAAVEKAEQNSLPSSEDLDVVAAEQEIANNTRGE